MSKYNVFELFKYIHMNIKHRIWHNTANDKVVKKNKPSTHSVIFSKWQ